MCSWLWVGQPLCCRRVSAGDQPTSVSLPVWRGHFLKCSKSSGVVWSHGQRVCSSVTWMCLQASHLATLVRNGSCSLRSWTRCEVGHWGCGLQDGGGVHPYSFGDDVFRLGGHGYESLFRLSLCEVGVDVVEDVRCVWV